MAATRPCKLRGVPTPKSVRINNPRFNAAACNRMRLLIEDEEFNFNPAANVGRLNKKHDTKHEDETVEEIEIVREDQVYELGAVVKALDVARTFNPSHYPVLACGFLSGLRMGEQIALRPIDIDCDSHVIKVRPNFYRNRITSPKGNRRRKVDIEPRWRKSCPSSYRPRKPPRYAGKC